MVKSVSSGRGFVNDAMVVQWDPFGEIVQTEVDGWNVVECSDIDFTRGQNSTFLSKILPKHKLKKVFVVKKLGFDPKFEF